MRKYVDILETVYSLSETDKKKINKGLVAMDEEWAIVDKMAFGLLGGSLACAKDKAMAWEWLHKIWTLVMEINKASIATMKEYNIEATSRFDRLGTDITACLSTAESQERNFSNLGLVMAVQFITRLSEMWMTHLSILANARAVLIELCPEAGSMVLEVHEHNIAMLDRRIQAGIFAMNSSIFRRIEEWAKKASLDYDGLMRSGYIPQSAYYEVIAKFGSPWL